MRVSFNYVDQDLFFFLIVPEFTDFGLIFVYWFYDVAYLVEIGISIVTNKILDLV